MGHLLDPEDVDALFEIVKSAKAKWRDIGHELGFTLNEMNNIVAKKGDFPGPGLLPRAPGPLAELGPSREILSLYRGPSGGS